MKIRNLKRILTRHADMVLDPWRTVPLQKAIDKVVKRGDVVCDIGSGLGLLSFFALSAGAKRVYAIDSDEESIDVAISFARKHGVFDRISFVKSHSADVWLPEKADVIICETVGSAAFDENILATLHDAKKRLLKRAGRIIPSVIELLGAPAAFGRTISKNGMIDIAPVAPKGLLSEPKTIARMVSAEPFGTSVHSKKTFTINKEGIFSGMAVWPVVQWTTGITTDASPKRPPTHWKQCVLPEKRVRAKNGDRIAFELIMGPDPSNPRDQTEILWKVKFTR